MKRTDGPYSHLSCIYALGQRPHGHDIIHDAFTQRPRHVMQFHEFADAVKHVMVTAGGRVHLLEDGRDVTEDRGV